MDHTILKPNAAKEWLQHYLLDKNGNPSRQKKKKHLTPQVLEEMKSLTGLDGSDINQMIYAIMHDVTTPIPCRHCGKPVALTPTGEPRMFCSLECLNASDHMKHACSDAIKTAWAKRGDEILEKRKKTNLEKYGVEHILQQKGIATAAQDKCRQKKIENFRKKKEEYRKTLQLLPQQAHYPERTLFMLQDGTEIIKLYREGLSINEISKKVGCSGSTISNWIESRGLEKRWVKITAETEIVDFIRSIAPDLLIIQRDRLVFKNKLEMDVWIPEKKVAIDYHGIYWHGLDENEVESMYTKHQKRYLTTHGAGIKLIQFFEDEWKLRREACQGLIAGAIGMTQKVHARDCEVVVLEKAEATEFFEINHLKKSARFEHAIGLRHNGLLVSAMSFGKPRFTDHDWEIIRFASAIGLRVVGGAGRMMSHFRRDHPGSIMTYADLRFGDGAVYEKLGFKDIGMTKPGYSWFFKGQRIPRTKTQKHVLGDLLGDAFNPNLTEDQNMFSIGALKVFDAGNRRFELVC